MTDPNAFLHTPACILPTPPWAGDDALGRVMDVLNDGSGAPPRTLLVGGCVRDAALGRGGGDVDLATCLTPDQVMARATAAGLKVIPTGIDHGTATVVCEGRGFEVTTLRRDIATDGRHAVVGFTDDWMVDAQRRDFTINTLLADIKGHVYDPLGTGVADARAGRVVFVGDPAARIAEDYLRILRFFRFCAYYGQGEMDARAVAACRAAAPHMATLSVERITAELIKWVMADHPTRSLKIAFENNVLDIISEVMPDFDRLGRVIRLQKIVNAVDPLPRLFVLNPRIANRLRLSSKQISMLQDLLYFKYDGDFGPQAVRRMIYTHGRAVAVGRYIIDLAAADQTPSDAVIAVIQGWTPPTLPITGADLITAGISPGPEMGARLKRAEGAWVESDFTLSQAGLIKIALN